MTDGRHKLVLQDGKPDMLFDLESDPWEDANIAGERGNVVDLLKATSRQDSGK